MNPVKAAFRPDIISVPIEKILPSRKLKAELKSLPRYKVIEASVREVGIIEPLVVYPKGANGLHVLLDGHVRMEVLRSLGRTEVSCLVSTDDENCTYNHRVSRITPIQEHRMIMKAIESGVSEERIAKALNVSPKSIRQTKTRLVDISREAIDFLKDKPVTNAALKILKKVKPYRQQEMAELMVMSNSYSAAYAKVLLVTTPPEHLVAPRTASSKPDQLAKLENEMRSAERDFILVEETYSHNALNLQLARSYVKTLLQNARVTKYLGQKHAELVAQLQRVVDVTSLDG
jgi:ParB-like chromosome segregation protein Spo0J